jgi:MoxR-like ATPase
MWSSVAIRYIIATLEYWLLGLGAAAQHGMRPGGRTETKGTNVKLHEKIAAIEVSMNADLVERRDSIRALLLAFVTQEHVFFFGPPGTAKTRMIEDLRACVVGSRSCYRLAHRFMTADELIGPMDLGVFQREHRFVRNLTGGIADTEFAFLDEVFKANSAVLNTLLPILNERRLDESTPIPLRTCASASNEFPSDESLGALYDRFLLRERVEYIKGDRAKLALLARVAAKGKRSQAFVAPVQVSLGEWDQIATEVDAVTIPTAVLEAQLRLEKDLAKQNIFVSDRRSVQALRVIKAEAWLNGEATASVDDLQALRYIYWNTTKEQDALISLLGALDRTITGEVLAVLDAAISKWELRPTEPSELRSRLPELERSVNVALAEGRERAKKLGKRAQTKVADRGRELRAIHDEIKALLRAQYNL